MIINRISTLIFIFFYVFNLDAFDTTAKSVLNSNQERIISFNSEIIIHKNASIEVTETITVLAKGYSIKRGIFREFPTIYYDDLGNRYVIGFEIIKILKNGNPVNYHVENLSNGKIIYVGNKQEMLKPGTYVYKIKYKTNRQIGFFPKFDEFYWNVTGNSWRLPIEEASASVTLPKEINMSNIKFDGYTGYLDSKEKNFKAFVGGNKIIFRTTAMLEPNQGFTIDVAWDKGHIKEPSVWTKIYYFLKDNINIVWLIVCLVTLLTFYLLFWIKTRIKDKEVIIPLFEPPDDLTPGDVRFIQKMEYDNRIFTAEILNMAVNGFLTIQFQNGTYTLIKGNQPDKSSDYFSIWNRLFSSNSELVLNENNSATINHVIDILKSNLEFKCKEKYFVSNIPYVSIGLLISIFAIVPQIVSSNVILLPLSVILLILINVIFSHLIKIYTEEGKKVKNQIKGFKMFLSATERERLKILVAPERTPNEFEKLLPYAVALGVEEKWNKQFKSIFEKLDQKGDAYVPNWYAGKNYRTFYMSNVSSSLNTSLSSIISSSSIPPGITSGFGGKGGSSGRGGGGGGGGGW